MIEILINKDILPNSRQSNEIVNINEVNEDDLKELIVTSARDGEHLNLITSFVKKDIPLKEEEYKECIRDILYIANLKGNDEVIKTVFKANPSCIEFIENYFLDYQHLKDIHTEVIGEEINDCVSEGT